MKIKEITKVLKTGEKILLFCPTINDTQQLVDHANKVFAETKFLSLGEEDGNKTTENEIKWIESIVKAERSFIVAGKIDDKVISLCNISAKLNN